MAKYIRNKNGKFAGSIGDGKQKTPSTLATPVSPDTSTAPDEAPNIDELYSQLVETRTPRTLLVADINGAARIVTPGILDDDARILFTRGHCHSLALAMHEATGHPIIAFRPVKPGRYDADGHLEAPDWDWEHDCTDYQDADGSCHQCMYYEPDHQLVTHFAVKIGPNTMLDATGAHDLHEYSWRNNYEPIETTADGVEYLMYDPEVSGDKVGMWLTPDIALGRKFADAVYDLLP